MLGTAGVDIECPTGKRKRQRPISVTLCYVNSTAPSSPLDVKFCEVIFDTVLVLTETEP